MNKKWIKQIKQIHTHTHNIHIHTYL